jgi:hypothetical protein
LQTQTSEVQGTVQRAKSANLDVLMMYHSQADTSMANVEAFIATVQTHGVYG